MINASTEFIQAIQSGRTDYKMQIRMTLTGGTIVNLNQTRIWGDTVKLEDATAQSDDFAVGTFVSTKLSFSINNYDGAYSDDTAYNFYDAALTRVWIGLDIDGTTEWISLGQFWVDSVDYDGSLISFVCTDAARFFNKPYNSALSYIDQTNLPTLRDIVNEAANASYSNISVTESFPNETRPVSKPFSHDSITYADVVAMVAQLAGGYAKFDANGVLQICQYGTLETTYAFLTSEEKYLHTSDNKQFCVVLGNQFDPATAEENGYHAIISLKEAKIQKHDCFITKVVVVEEDPDFEEQVSASYPSDGTNDYVLTVSGNRLIQRGEALSSAHSIWDAVAGKKFRPLSISTLTNPLIEAGDMIYVVTNDGSKYFSYVTSRSMTLGSGVSIECAGSPITANGLEQTSYTELSKAIASERQRSSVEKEMLERSMYSSMGLYESEEPAQGGGVIKYYHDQPTRIASTYIWKFDGDSITVSSDGGAHWNAALTAGGSAMLKYLAVDKVEADWIKTGILSDHDGDNWWNLGTGQINFASGLTITSDVIIKDDNDNGYSLVQWVDANSGAIANIVAKQAQQDGLAGVYGLLVRPNDSQNSIHLLAKHYDEHGDPQGDTLCARIGDIYDRLRLSNAETATAIYQTDNSIRLLATDVESGFAQIRIEANQIELSVQRTNDDLDALERQVAGIVITPENILMQWNGINSYIQYDIDDTVTPELATMKFMDDAGTLSAINKNGTVFYGNGTNHPKIAEVVRGGMYFYDENGVKVSQFTRNGATFLRDGTHARTSLNAQGLYFYYTSGRVLSEYNNNGAFFYRDSDEVDVITNLRTPLFAIEPTKTTWYQRVPSSQNTVRFPRCMEISTDGTKFYDEIDRLKFFVGNNSGNYGTYWYGYWNDYSYDSYRFLAAEINANAIKYYVPDNYNSAPGDIVTAQILQIDEDGLKFGQKYAIGFDSNFYSFGITFNYIDDVATEVHFSTSYIAHLYIDFDYSYFSGDLTVDDDFYCNGFIHGTFGASDARLKKNISSTTIKALDALTALDMKSYDWIKDDEHTSVGIIAQQLKTVAPELVAERGKDSLEGIDYMGLLNYCVKAIQELADLVGYKPKKKAEWTDPYTLEEKLEYNKRRYNNG